MATCSRLWPAIVTLVVRPFSLLLVLFAYLLIIAVVFLYLRHLVPLWAPFESTPLQNIAMNLLALFFVVNIFFNYTACTFMGPGTPPDCSHVDLKGNNNP